MTAPRILLVEDDPVTARLVTHTLGTRGHSVRRFEDAETAIEALTGEAPALRARLALVPQDSLLFRGTLRENLYVVVGAEADRARGLTLDRFRAARAQGPAPDDHHTEES